MPVFTTKLKDKKEIARETMAFMFEKPQGLSFRAGNNFDWMLINPPETDEEGNTRAFSLASAPYEDFLMIATRMRDTAFKRVLKGMSIGTELKIEGPFGSFHLHNDSSKPAVFLAGGIGITPFRSMVLQAAHEKLPHKIFLFYSNHTQTHAAFLQELIDVESKYPNYKLIAVMTKDETWSGEKEHVNKDIIEKYVKDLSAPIYYIAGPPEMVSAMRQMLTDAGIDEDNIRWEEFAGYS